MLGSCHLGFGEMETVGFLRHWPVGLTELVSYSFTERPCLKIQIGGRLRKTPDFDLWPICIHTHVHVPTHIHAHICEHVYTHTHTLGFMSKKNASKLFLNLFSILDLL